MLFRRGLHLLLLLFTNCWLSLTSHTISVLQCWTVSCTCIRYAIGAVAETERVWLARLTCISDKSEKVTSWQDISFEKNVWNGSEDAKATKQSELYFREDKTRTAFHQLLCEILLKTSAMVVSSFTRYKPLRMSQICINKRPLFL